MRDRKILCQVKLGRLLQLKLVGLRGVAGVSEGLIPCGGSPIGESTVRWFIVGIIFTNERVFFKLVYPPLILHLHHSYLGRDENFRGSLP